MDDSVIFEFPTHNIVRQALKLEHLFDVCDSCVGKQEAYEHRLCLNSLCQILKILEKPEIKSKLLGELTRFNHTFVRLLEKKDADSTKIGQYLDVLSKHLVYLNDYGQQFSAILQQNVLLTSLKHQTNDPGGDCCCKNPQLHAWLNKASSDRFANLMYWLELLAPVKSVIHCYLNLIRLSSHFEKIMAHKAFYQCTLSPKAYCHMARIQINSHNQLFPKVNIGQHGLSLQLFQLTDSGDSVKYFKDTPIEVALCNF